MKKGAKKKDEREDLHGFFDEFVNRHRIPYGTSYRLIVTDDDCMELGEFFIRGMIGWAGGYDLVRVPETMRRAFTGNEPDESDRLEDEDETEDDRFIN